MTWQQWMQTGGLIVLAPFVLFMWWRLDELKEIVARLPFQAAEEATVMDDKIWDEIRELNRKFSQHQEISTRMHMDNIKALAEARIEMRDHVTASTERILKAMKELQT